MSDAIGADQLKSYIERIERLEEEKAALVTDIREVYQEAKGNGFAPKIMRECVKLRRMDENDRAEFESIRDLYMHALGMEGTPLGDYADQKEAEPSVQIDLEACIAQTGKSDQTATTQGTA